MTNVGFPLDRFWAKVDSSAGPDGCWPWRAYIGAQGYGRFNVGSGRIETAHRIAYMLRRGPIPHGMVIDHLCRNRACVNPRHLDLVTDAENIRRGQSPTMLLHAAGTCAQGHPASESYRRKSTGAVVYCRACRRERRSSDGHH